MVVTMPASLRDLRNRRYWSQLRLLTSRVGGVAAVDDAVGDALNGPLLLLLLLAEEVVERARALRASVG